MVYMAGEFDPTIGQYQRGELQLQTVDAAGHAALLGQVLEPDLPDGIYLGVGTASDPYFRKSSRAFTAGARYVGLDGGKSEYMPRTWPDSYIPTGWAEYNGKNAQLFMDAALSSINEQPNGAYGDLIWADAQVLPLPNGSIRETFMRDVLLIAGVHPDSVELLASEQARVLPENGVMIIRETNPGSLRGEAMGVPRSDLRKLLAILDRNGFGKRTLVETFDPEVSQLARIFPHRGKEDVFSGYYLICQQGQAQQMPETTAPMASALPRWKRAASDVLNFLQGRESDV